MTEQVSTRFLCSLSPPQVSPNETLILSAQELERRNTELERRLRLAEQTLSETLSEREKMFHEVTKVAEIMDMKIFELSELRQDLAKLVESN